MAHTHTLACSAGVEGGRLMCGETDQPTPQTEDGLFQRAQTRATPLLRKLANLTDDEWSELTHRMTKHFDRELARRGMVVVPAAQARTEAPDVERVQTLAEDVRYASGNGTSDYWRGFNDGIDRVVERVIQDHDTRLADKADR
jgi:hypothetical protein